MQYFPARYYSFLYIEPYKTILSKECTPKLLSNSAKLHNLDIFGKGDTS